MQRDAVRGLTILDDDERLFRDSVFEFADREIRPLVREMDDKAHIPRSLIDGLFDLGVMGIGIPEAHGGAGASFFHAVLAIEALSRVDPSVAVLVDVHNTLVIIEPAGVVVVNCLADLGLAVHHKRPLTDNWLVDRLAGQHQQD